MTEQLHFTASKNPNQPRPVSFYKGRIAVIQGRSLKGDEVKAGEDWLCEIVEELSNLTVISPVKLMVTAEENCEKVRIAALKLKEQWGCK